MNNNFKWILTSILTVAFGLGAFALPARADQPFMQAALADLTKAQTSLKRATADKGGNRQRALDFTAAAINAVKDGIAYDRRNSNNRRRNDVELNNETFLMVFDQPNMQDAKVHLQNALDNLQKASPDKGGYRTKAIGLVKDAFNATQAGIEFDRRN